MGLLDSHLDFQKERIKQYRLLDANLDWNSFDNWCAGLGLQPKSIGWQLVLQGIKLRKHGLNLKKIIIIAEPNGAGKTTFARDFLPAEAQTLRFINADLIALPNEDIAVSRVARRVLQGGHDIPEDVIRRRFKSGLENFHERYSKVVNSWALYDNSGIESKIIDWSNK